jgi:AraC-like DNA-binding protein
MGEISPTRIEIASTDPGKITETLSKLYSGLVVKPHSPHLEISFEGILGSIGDLRYDISSNTGGIDILPVTDAALALFTFPTFGGMSVEMPRSTLETSATEAVATITADVHSYKFPEPRKQTNLAFDLDKLRRRLIAMFDTSTQKPLIFEPVVSLTTERFAPLVWLTRGLAQPDLAYLGDMAAAPAFSNLVIDMLLELWPHSHGHLFQRRTPSLAPRQVRTAINYIHAHAQEAPSVETLADISGVSLRALQYAFHEATGMTISDYQRQVRLQRAKDDILKNTDEPLADIAKRWGFSNIGRFSRQFHDLFGGYPSEFRKR